MWTKLQLSFFFASILAPILIPYRGWGSACCGRNAVGPVLIIGDDQALFNLSSSAATVVAETDQEGWPRPVTAGEFDFTHTLRMDTAFLISDRIQLGFGGSAVYHQVSNSFSTGGSNLGIGDMRLSTAYELLPEWHYSVWEPQIFIFTSFTVPTGRSLYDLNEGYNITGNGFYSISLGIILLKRWSSIDFFLTPEIHYSFARRFDMPNLNPTYVIPGFGGSVTVGAGWSPLNGKFRFGLRLLPRIDQGHQVISSVDMTHEHGLVPSSSCDVGMDVSYMLSVADSLFLSYTDQSWIRARSINQNRIFAIQYQHRWER